jgi:6-phosphogluconolactonase
MNPPQVGKDASLADDMAYSPPAIDCGSGAPPAVYATTNDLAGNAIQVYPRAADGSLSMPAQFSTGGLGSSHLYEESQGALIYDPAQQLFLTVNSGDDTISMMLLHSEGFLELLSNAPSGGTYPKSVTIYKDLVYVLNNGQNAVDGGPDGASAAAVGGNISGLRIVDQKLVPIPGSTQPLSQFAVTGAAQVNFTPDGKILIVTERRTDRIDTYLVDSSGVAGPPKIQKSSGVTPYGFGFSAGGQVIVSESHRGDKNLSSISTYSIDATGTLTPITKALPTHQTDDCWIVVNGPYAYGTNTQESFSITGVRVSPSGELSLLDDDGITGKTGQGCEDEAITNDAQFLYTLNILDRTISVFHLESNGQLTKLPDYKGIPGAAAGLVAR